jgi:glyoxylase-like metal-dependent hydrolase (beta-lactamase superfamily II)
MATLAHDSPEFSYGFGADQLWERREEKVETPSQPHRINSVIQYIFAVPSQKRHDKNLAPRITKEKRMRTKFSLLVVAVLLLAVTSAGAEEIAGLPLHTEKIGDGAIRVWIGDYVSSTSIVAFATEKGIVVVDTFGVPGVDTQLREVIARELGRNDFAFLINTHEHADHTGGNSAYSDCTIVGHELIAEGLETIAGRRDLQLEWYPGRIADLEEELAGLDPNDPRVAVIEEDLVYNRLFFEAVKSGRELLTPTLTFSDRLTLDLGDTSFHLSYIGGMHSASDAAVFVPEHGLLLTGDTMADVWLTDRPGCLAAFMVRDRMPHDFPRWLANWDRLLADRASITTLLPGHWNGNLSIDGAQARVEYVRALWSGIGEAYEAGKGLEEVQAEYRLDVRFPDLVESPGFTQQQNYASITEMWREITGQPSAARTLYALLEEGADEAAIREVLTDSTSPGYFFSEAEFNAYGYTFLRQEKIENAITMFKINADLYPESWNVYDSLGEALLQAGKAEEAAAMYEKSIVLNPENNHGKEVLAKIQGAEAT